MSQNSVESPYVTYEWAYGWGKGKNLVPMKLDGSKVHPRLESIQYLDLSVPGFLPWEPLVEHILDIEAHATSQEDLAAASAPEPPQQDSTVTAILDYLTQRGYQMVSYDRIKRRIDPNLTNEALDALVAKNPTIFRPAKLKEDKPGLAKQIP